MDEFPSEVKRRYRNAKSKGRKLALVPKEPKLIIARQSLVLLAFVDKINKIILDLLLSALEQEEVRQDAVTPYIQRTLDLIELRIAELVKAPTIERASEQTAKELLAGQTRQWKRLIKVEIDPAVQPLIRGFVQNNTTLIKSQTSQTVAQIRQFIDGKVGQRVEDLAEEIEHRLNVRKSKARFIARDQTLKLNGQISQAVQTSVGIVEYEWVTAGDSDVRETHEDLDGTIQRWDTPPVVSDDGRQEHPGGDYQCRCVALAIIPD